jgi:hypothetical protein
MCTEYEEIRHYKLAKTVFPADTDLSERLLGRDIRKEAMERAIPEFLEYNIVECEVING